MDRVELVTAGEDAAEAIEAPEDSLTSVALPVEVFVRPPRF